MKWKKEMQTRNLDETNVSQGLKTKIKDYYELEEGIQSLKEAIADPSINDDVEELKADLEELQEALEVADRKLVDAVILFDKNKDKYAEKVQKMKEGREKKKGANVEPKKEASTQSQPQPQVQVQQPQVQKNETAKTEEKDGEKKKSNIGNWIFGLAIAGLTLGLATQYLKNRD
jgi:SMC interacting uncharacterized protein involved in chromosome segregation